MTQRMDEATKLELSRHKADDWGSPPPERDSIVGDILYDRMKQLHDMLGDDAPFDGVQQTFAFLVNRGEVCVSRWRCGRRPIPDWVWLVLNALTQVAEVGGHTAVKHCVRGHLAERRRKATEMSPSAEIENSWRYVG